MMQITKPSYPQSLAQVGFPSSVAWGIHSLPHEDKAQLLVLQAEEVLESLPSFPHFRPDAVTTQWLQSLSLEQRLILIAYLVLEIR
jgi:hypothetical protein